MELKLLELSKDFDISDDLKRAIAQHAARQIVEWVVHSQFQPTGGEPPYIRFSFTAKEWQELKRAAGLDNK